MDEIDVETLRSQCTQRMLQTFNDYINSSGTHIHTSLGFDVNANLNSVQSIDLCIAQLESGVVPQTEGSATIEYRDYADKMQALTVEQLRQIKAEMGANISRAYAKKWDYEAQLKTADRETLKNINFSFS